MVFKNLLLLIINKLIMSNIRDIIIKQKEKLEKILNYYQQIIDNFERGNDVYNEEVLSALESNDNFLDEYSNNIEKIQHNFDLNIIDKTDIELKRIENYQIQQKIFKLFMPYMIYMRLMLKTKNE